MFKDKDFSSKDKDCIVKDQDKDCILVLKESLRTRTNTTGDLPEWVGFRPPSLHVKSCSAWTFQFQCINHSVYVSFLAAFTVLLSLIDTNDLIVKQTITDSQIQLS